MGTASEDAHFPPDKKPSIWKVVIIFGIVLFLGIQLTFVFLGEVNADEGWYLYAGKLVYAGQRPYQDFAYTQTPLLPYIYGIPQVIFTGSIYVGRATSAVFSMLGLLLSFAVARRYGGDAAGGVTVLLWASCSYGLYYLTITKTYTLTAFFFVLTLFVLSLKDNQQRNLILATIIVLLATFTRLSAFSFALPVLIYAFITAERRTKFMMATIFSVAIFFILFFSVPDMEAIRWNLLTYHTTNWSGLSFGEQLWQIIRYRIHPLFIVYPAYLFLVVILTTFGFRHTKKYLGSNPELSVILVGLLLFLLPNMTSGAYFTEYFVPLFFGLFPIIGILYIDLYHRSKFRPKLILTTLIVVALGIGLFRGGWHLIDLSGGTLPVEEIQEVAEFVTEFSDKDDLIFALEALWVVVEADRKTPPNMTLAQFSFYRGETDEAEALHLINEQITLNYFRAGIPKLIILTERDWKKIDNSQNSDLIIAALEEKYVLEFEKTDWGQSQESVGVYSLREGD